MGCLITIALGYRSCRSSACQTSRTSISTMPAATITQPGTCIVLPSPAGVALSSIFAIMSCRRLAPSCMSTPIMRITYRIKKSRTSSPVKTLHRSTDTIYNDLNSTLFHQRRIVLLAIDKSALSFAYITEEVQLSSVFSKRLNTGSSLAARSIPQI